MEIQGDEIHLDLGGMPSVPVILMIGPEEERPKITYAGGLCIIFITSRLHIRNVQLQCTKKTPNSEGPNAAFWDKQGRQWCRTYLQTKTNKMEFRDEFAGTITLREDHIILSTEHGEWTLINEPIAGAIKEAKEHLLRLL